MMICVSCRRRTDPNRSFCTNCGSAVFVDSQEAARLSPSGPEPAAPRVARRPRQNRKAAADLPALNTIVPTLPIWPLIKLAFFIWLVWKGAGLAMGVPEVRTFVEAAMRGESPDIQPAIDAVRDRAQSFLQDTANSTATTTEGDSVPVRRRVPPPPPPPPALPMPDATAAPTAVAPTAIGSSAPRVIRRVAATYTDVAQREKIEGSVLLRALVLPDGSVSEIAVVRSLDKKFGLDDQAITALRQWRFEPALSNGEAVRTYVEVEINFRLR